MDKAQKPITLSTGQTIPVLTLNGIVADNQHSSSTRVYSSGGGGYVGPNGGFVDAAEIHSEVTTRQSVWITDDQSKDTEIWFRNRRIPLRVGQQVTASFVKPPGSREWRLETFVNHSTQQVHSWLAENPAPIDLMAADRGSPLAMACVLGGAAGCWYAWTKLSGTSNWQSFSAVLWVGVMLLSSLGILEGRLRRNTRRSKLRALLTAEYVAAVNDMKDLPPPAGAINQSCGSASIVRATDER
jgi:hypothetical protein